MKETAEIDNFFAMPEHEPSNSIFYDRYETPFRRWLEEQGLPEDASDELVLSAMTAYLQTKETASIKV